MTQSTKPSPPTAGGKRESLRVEAFDPDQVRPWRFHNRRGSGMDDESIEALAQSIAKDGQQQLGLARRLAPGGTHQVEAIFGVRRLEACRRAGVPWRAEVRDASFSDARCASLMHGENEWTAGVSPLENAVQWQSLLQAGVFKNQSALADEIGCHRGRVSRGLRNARVLFGEKWIEGLVRPVMHDFSGRSADRLAEALSDPDRRALAELRAQALAPGAVGAEGLHDALCGEKGRARRTETLFVQRRDGAAGGPVTAAIQRDAKGGWTVRVGHHERTPAQHAELAERLEALLAVEAASAAGVRLGRRLVASLSPEEARDAAPSWLEGCVWSAARASGLDWDRWRCAAVAEALRRQTGGWERAVVRAVGDAQAKPSGEAGRT